MGVGESGQLEKRQNIEEQPFPMAQEPHLIPVLTEEWNASTHFVIDLTVVLLVSPMWRAHKRKQHIWR